MTFVLIVIYSRRNMTTTTITTDENPQKHLLIEKEENEETKIKKQNLTPFSDLTDDQLYVSLLYIYFQNTTAI